MALAREQAAEDYPRELLEDVHALLRSGSLAEQSWKMSSQRQVGYVRGSQCWRSMHGNRIQADRHISTPTRKKPQYHEQRRGSDSKYVHCQIVKEQHENSTGPTQDTRAKIPQPLSQKGVSQWDDSAHQSCACHIL
jgi:hypothetical protein